MAVGFGFSLSDLCMGLKLIKDSIEALDDKRGRGAAAEYQSIVTDITSLYDALEAIEDALSDTVLSLKQTAALNRTTSACQKSVEDFVLSISKYQPHLRANATGLQSKYHKIKWALCKNEDVAKFRAQIGR